MSTAVLDLTPDWVTLKGYAGDDLNITFLVNPIEYVTGATWAAQVRRTPHDPEVLEQFTPEPVTGGMCMKLTGEQTERLVELGKLRRSVGCNTTIMFEGAWDCQVTFPDGRVQTFGRGSITIEADVTHTPELP